MADPRKFIATTDYPMPFLAFFKKCQFSVPRSEGFAVKSFPHGLPFTPLLAGQWSTNASFSPAYDIGDQVPDPADDKILIVGADANNIYFLPENHNYDYTFYVRLMGFAPPDYSGSVDELSDITKFRFNTDYDYPKLVKSGGGTIAANQAVSIQHNLGYVPFCNAWITAPMGSASALQPARYDRTWDGAEYGPEVTASQLIIHGRNSGKYYYHILAEGLW